jgi:hypothetical protein
MYTKRTRYSITHYGCHMSKIIIRKWRYNSTLDIDNIVSLLRYLLAYTHGVMHCRNLMWDMHLIYHRFDKNPHKRGYNRFAGLHAKHKEVWGRIGDAVAFFEYAYHSAP